MTDPRPLLLPPERFVAVICIFLLALGILIAILRAQQVDWATVTFRLAVATGVGAGGATYRRLGRSEGIALALIGTGLFVAFTNFALLVNYMFLPVIGPVIDTALTRFDAALGYVWRDYVLALGEFPSLMQLLRSVYLSSAAQMIGMILVLGFLERQLAMHRFLVAGTIAGLTTVAIWSVLPSFGPAAYQPLPPDSTAAALIVADNAYGRILLQLAERGTTVLRPDAYLGTIAFPSFHTVMALLAVWYARGIWLFWPVLALNLLMLPAILLHGGHHLADVLGGAGVFALSAFLAGRLVPGTTAPDRSVAVAQR